MICNFSNQSAFSCQCDISPMPNVIETAREGTLAFIGVVNTTAVFVSSQQIAVYLK